MAPDARTTTAAMTGSRTRWWRCWTWWWTSGRRRTGKATGGCPCSRRSRRSAGSTWLARSDKYSGIV
uniref:Uncharacterized protein n=1 Tax=Arundo donax TaxID=35708 RepID=A0A0A9EU08_ARUDO